MIKIYIADVISNEKITPFFSEYRIKRLSATKNENKRFQSATAERLLCYAAKKEGVGLPVDIKIKNNGKPYAENLYFSISHSDKKVLVAVADCEVGADIQKINQSQNLTVAKKFLTEEEMQNLDVNAFFKLFSMKESYFKMTGEGLPLAPVSFENFEKCYFKTIVKDEYCISVCAANPFELTVENVPCSFLDEF